MEFIRSVVLEDHTTATETIEKDLPTGAISHCVLSMDGYNVTDEATLAEILAFIETVEVSRGGVTVHSLQSEDLYGVNAYLFKRKPVLTGKLATDNLQRNLGLIVPFGREIFNPDECHPATSKGDLTLRVKTTVPSASLDNSQFNIDAIQLVGATPKRYLKSTLRVIAAPGQTGDNLVDLPIGNEIVCVQLRMVTVPAASSHVYGVEKVSILVNEKEYGYSAASAPCLEAERMFRSDEQHGAIAAQGLEPTSQMLWVDFDPRGDGQFLLQTKGLTALKARLTMGVNEAVYMTVIELVTV